MAQQTAVEWLVEQLQAPCRGIPSHIIEQAKQMEKEQLENARPQVISNCIIKEISDEEIENEAERYEKVDGVNSFKEAIKWYREQLKKNI